MLETPDRLIEGIPHPGRGNLGDRAMGGAAQRSVQVSQDACQVLTFLLDRSHDAGPGSEGPGSLVDLRCRVASHFSNAQRR